MKTHPAVEDCSVQGFQIQGIGTLPRAYIILKSGYIASAEELVHHVNSKVDITERLLGGVAFVESGRLAKDVSGKLFHKLDKYDSTATGMDEQILQQPRVDVS